MDITLARVTQIVFRLLMALLVGKLGIDSQHATSIAQPAAEATGAALLFLLDLFIHSKRFGSLKDQVEFLLSRSAPFATPPASSNDDGHANPEAHSNFIDRTLGMFLVAGLLLSLLFASGCANTAQRQWAQHQQTLDNFTDGLVTSNRNGIVSDKAFVATEPYVAAAQSYIDTEHTVVKAGGKPSAAILSGLNSALGALAGAIATGQAGAVPPPPVVPATQPK